MLKNLSGIKILFIAIFSILLSLIFIALYIFNVINDVVLIGGCIFSFLAMSLSLNEITSRMVNKKFANKFSNPKEYLLEDNLDALKEFTSNKVNFGYTYLYIHNKVAYKVVIVENNDLYFNNQEKSSVTNKKIDQCTKFFGFEIFNEVDEAVIKKLELYSFQSDKIFYTAFYKKDNMLVQPNYEQPRDIHIEDFNYILNKLRMVENES